MSPVFALLSTLQAIRVAFHKPPPQHHERPRRLHSNCHRSHSPRATGETAVALPRTRLLMMHLNRFTGFMVQYPGFDDLTTCGSELASSLIRHLSLDSRLTSRGQGPIGRRARRMKQVAAPSQSAWPHLPPPLLGLPAHRLLSAGGLWRNAVKSSAARSSVLTTAQLPTGSSSATPMAQSQRLLHRRLARKLLPAGPLPGCAPCPRFSVLIPRPRMPGRRQRQDLS